MLFVFSVSSWNFTEALGQSTDNTRAIGKAIADLQQPLLLSERHRALALAMRFWTRDPEPHLTALRLLTLTPDDRAVNSLLELLQDSSFPYRVAVTDALAKTSDPRVPPALAEALADPDPALRSRSLRALGELAQQSAFDSAFLASLVPRLLRLLTADPDPLVRYNAYSTIFSSADWEAQVEALDLAARDPHPLLSCAYLRSTASLAQLSGEPSEVRRSAATIRARFSRPGPSYSERTFIRIYQLSRNPPCGLPAVEATWGLGLLRQEEDLVTLLELADNSEAAIREAAVGALAQFGGDMALGGIVQALSDPSLTIRAKAISVLSGFPEKQSGPLLEQSLSGRSAFLRLTAARTLADVHGRSKALVNALADPESQVRKAAGDALRELKEPDSVPLLVDKLSSEDDSQRVEAMRVLASYRGAESRAQLIAAMNTGAVPVAPLATLALGLRGEPEAREALEHALLQPGFPDYVAVVHALQDLQLSASLTSLGVFLNSTTDAKARAAATLAIRVISASSVTASAKDGHD